MEQDLQQGTQGGFHVDGANPELTFNKDTPSLQMRTMRNKQETAHGKHKNGTRSAAAVLRVVDEGQ
jgi:hypothetical protein